MSFLHDKQDEVMSEINMTPLVDVMLVLLIIFIITVPVINHAVKLDLPQASHTPLDSKPEHINLSLTADGNLSWNKQHISPAELEQQIQQAAQQSPQPEIHLWADHTVPYGQVVKLMTQIQAGGLNKIGFVTDPSK